MCPVIIPAKKGHYSLPVSVAKNLTLITRNIPPPVSTLLS